MCNSLHAFWRTETALLALISSRAAAQTVFAIVSFGAVMLTVNVVLLGGNIGFFQVRLWSSTCSSRGGC